MASCRRRSSKESEAPSREEREESKAISWRRLEDLEEPEWSSETCWTEQRSRAGLCSIERMEKGETGVEEAQRAPRGPRQTSPRSNHFLLYFVPSRVPSRKHKTVKVDACSQFNREPQVMAEERSPSHKFPARSALLKRASWVKEELERSCEDSSCSSLQGKDVDRCKQNKLVSHRASKRKNRHLPRS